MYFVAVNSSVSVPEWRSRAPSAAAAPAAATPPHLAAAYTHPAPSSPSTAAAGTANAQVYGDTGGYNVPELQAKSTKTRAQVQAELAQARAKGVRVLIGDPGRTYFPRTGLDFLAEYRVLTSRELEDQEIKRSSVWAMP